MQEIDNPHIELLVLDHIRFQEHVKCLVPGMVFVIQNASLIELHYSQEILTCTNNPYRSTLNQTLLKSAMF